MPQGPSGADGPTPWFPEADTEARGGGGAWSVAEQGPGPERRTAESPRVARLPSPPPRSLCPQPWVSPRDSSPCGRKSPPLLLGPASAPASPTCPRTPAHPSRTLAPRTWHLRTLEFSRREKHRPSSFPFDYVQSSLRQGEVVFATSVGRLTLPSEQQPRGPAIEAEAGEAHLGG